MDGLGGVLGLEEEELGHDNVGSVVGDGAVDADDPLLQQPREYVVGALPAGRVLYDHRDQAVVPAVGGRARERTEALGTIGKEPGGGGQASQERHGGALGLGGGGGGRRGENEAQR